MDRLVATARRLRASAAELAQRYEELVVRDPDLAGRVEAGLRLASYFLPGRLGGSWEISEMAYCVANLYSLFNDYIITKKCPRASKISKVPSRQRALLWLLSVVECVEVMVEVMSEVVMREPGKWATVILMQCVKAALRAVLVFYMRSGLLTSPPVPSPDRKQAKEAHSLPQLEEGQALAWKGPRTGKIIRSIHTDPSIPYSQLQHYVTPSPLPSPSHTHHPPSSLTTKQMIAEALYICRPLAHPFLETMANFHSNGLNQLHGGLLRWRSNEKSEIVRRRVLLLLYLLRAPFYDRYTKGILLRVLQLLSATVPLVHLIVDPVLTYIPVWQHTYCYNWMT